jgi:hypothetical protein
MPVCHDRHTPAARGRQLLAPIRADEESLMSDDAKRMFNEALERLNDAKILEQRSTTRGSGAGPMVGSSTLLSILGFEILLKCAIRISGQTPKPHHNYEKLWQALPGYASKEIFSIAKAWKPGHTDFSDLTKLLNWYQKICEKARYSYEFYEGYTFKEQKERGESWEERGAPTHEADVQLYPLELNCLIEGLKVYIESRLSKELKS